MKGLLSTSIICISIFCTTTPDSRQLKSAYGDVLTVNPATALKGINTSEKTDHNFTFTILNSIDKEIKYLTSNDNINWGKETLRNGYTEIFKNDKPEFYIKIYTNATDFVFYKLAPGECYKIVLNPVTTKFDLSKY